MRNHSARLLADVAAVLALVLAVVIAGQAWARPSGDFASAGKGAGRTTTTTRAPSMRGRLRGIDVSNYNGTIDWTKVAASGVQFAIAKASQGTGYDDPFYAANSTDAHAAGVRFTAYEFADPNPGASDPVQDADHFLADAALQPHDLVPVLDLEQTGGLGRAALVTWTSRWCHRVQTQLGVHPIIYSSPSFWQTHMGDTRTFARRGDPLWIANWFVGSPSVPAGNWHGKGWTLWQWSDRGSVRGISGRTDLDLLNGTSLRDLTIKHAH